MTRFFFLLSLSILLVHPASAQPVSSTGTMPSSSAGGSGDCDFTAIKESLYATESKGSGGYTARGPMTKYGVPLGKYQFIPPTQESMLNKYPDCNGSACHGEAILTPPCHPVQECIMDRYLGENLARAKTDPACKALIGQTITGSGQGKTLTCTVTEAGLVAGMHLGGGGVCRKISPNSAGPSDNLGTSVGYYVCKHGNNPVPGSCNSAANVSTSPSPGVPPPALSAWQLDSMQAVGETPYIMPVVDPDRFWWVGGLMLMAKQFTANMMAQVEAIGMFFDAKHQMETQRLFQEKTAEAHKDYQPSEQMCTFGTFSRDLLATERSANLTRNALSAEILQRDLGSGDSKGNDRVSDSLSRIGQFRKKFCDAKDSGGGLKNLCPDPVPADMKNRDINFTQTVDQPLSLKINLTDSTVTPDEEAVFALIDNLFAHDILPKIPKESMKARKYQYHYMNFRSIMAMRGVARNSIANIIALKTATPNTTDQTSAAPYLRALLREFGLQDAEIEETLGENPSYYAQMELLTKKIYQNPTFYTSLYDKPANVKRIRAAMKAVKLMQDRDIQASLIRREMLLSMIAEVRLRVKADEVYNATEGAIFRKE